MAKKKTTEATTSTEGIPSALISKADAVRDALKVGYDKPLAGVAFIKEKHGLDITPQVFSSYKTNEGKKGSGASVAVKVGNGKPSKNGHAGNPFAVAHDVKALVNKYGVEHVKAAVALFE